MNLYRRHNPSKCGSKELVACKHKRKPCPIWVRGTDPQGKYWDVSLKRLVKVQGRSVRDWAAAEKFLAEWERNGGSAPKAATRPTIEQWRTDNMADATTRGLASETLRKYQQLFSQLEAFAKDKGIRFANEFDVEITTAFRLSWNDKALSASKKLERLRSIMEFATEREWLAKNFASYLKAPIVRDSPTLPFTTDEMSKIMRAARTNQRVYTFIAVMRSSGLRISDVTRLAVANLNGNRLSLYQAKTGEPISIELDEIVADALRAVVPLNRNKDYFFWTGASTLRAAVSVWRRRMADVFKRAEIVNGHSHRLRDTFAVALLVNNTSIEDVSRLLGHKSIKITEKHYNPWVPERQKALDKAIKGANGWLKELQPAKRGKLVRFGGAA